MKKHFLVTLLAVLCLSLTSCIDFLEEITINKDGSGSFFMEMNMEKAMEKLAAMMPEEKQAEVREQGFLKEDDVREMDSLSQVINAKEGIRNFEIDNKGLVIQFSFDFDNIEQAYGAMGTMFDNGGDASNPASRGFGNYGSSIMEVKQKGKKYTFNRVTPAKAESEESNEEDPLGDMGAMMGSMMEGGTYESIIHFPGKVKVSGNKNASLSSDKKTVTIKTDLKELLENQNVGDFTAKYKVK